MSRNKRAAEAAASAASEAARTLAQRSHEVRQGAETSSEPAPERPEGSTSPERVEKLLKARPHAQATEDLLKRRGVESEEVKTETNEEKPSEAPVEAKVEPKSETEAATHAEEKKEPETPKTVRVKVDGEEFDAPAEEVEAAGGLKAYQLTKANENRLAKTNAALEETRKVQAQMAEWLQKQSQANQKPEPTDAQFIQERIDKIRFGSAEEAAQVLREVMDRGRPQVDQNQIVLRATTNFKYDMADQEFKREFADVLSNPHAAMLARVLESQRIAEYSPNGQANWQALSTVDWQSFKRKIGNELRTSFGRPSQPAAETKEKTGTTSQPSEKEARKASIVNLPTAAARAEGPKEEKELSPEEERKALVAQAKKARGQA
jgi:hypothetical protein